MLVVSNTSPISYLVIINEIDLLPLLFGRPLIPETVRDELASLKAPLAVQQWIAAPPEWLVIRPTLTCSDVELLSLDAGECAAIQLAESVEADLILLDDLAARLLAAKRGLVLTGVLGILDRAAGEGKVDFDSAITQLRQTNFRISNALVQSMRRKHARKSDDEVTEE
jgi:predicted nucleic acid-binding protein